MPLCSAHWFAASLALVAAGGCDSDETAPARTVEVWQTSGDERLLLERDERGTAFGAPTDGADAVVIAVDPEQRLQPIEGFGAAVTGSAAYVLSEHLDASARASLLTELFDPEAGIGLSYLRLPLGASDFSLRSYTYDDVPAGEQDPALARFSLDPEREHVLPVLREILAVAPATRIMGSPWSAPAWMKSSGSLNGGALLPEHYPAYAAYLARTLEAFQAERVPISALTVQNEPLHGSAAYPTMEMSAQEQAAFIGDHLGPLLERRGLDPALVAYDHNWDRPDYPSAVLADPEAARYVDGAAFHCYGGDVSAMGGVADAFPEAALYFTECSGGDWATDFSTNLQWNVRNLVVGTTRNGSRTALLWNLALDQDGGPTNGGCQDCRGVVTVDSRTGEVTRNVEYYVLAHASKFVRPGAHRIASDDVARAGVQNVAFRNADGRLVLLALNTTDVLRRIEVRVGGEAFTYRLYPRSVATFRWS